MTFQDRLVAWATQNFNLIFKILRIVKPVLVFGKQVVITRFDDVQEVLSRPEQFHVTYAERMGVITDGDNFFLGMQDTARYQQDVSNMRIVARRDDIEHAIKPAFERISQDLLANVGERFDVIDEYARRAPALWVADYFGIPGPSEDILIDWTTYMFQYLFYDNSPEADNAKAIGYGADCRDYLDELIQVRKNSPAQDDIIGRCLELQASGTPGMSDLAIRNNMIGLIVGAIPTLSKAFGHVMDHLLDHPEHLQTAHRLAANDDDEKLQKLVLECLRFNPFAPAVQRIIDKDYRLGRKTLKAGSRVLVATQSAMFDGRSVLKPAEFSLDRPMHIYMHFGYGMHTCFGQHINPVALAQMLKPLLKLSALKRAEGDAGVMQMREEFPTHLVLTHVKSQTLDIEKREAA